MGMRFNAHKCYVLSTKPRSHFYYRLGGTILKNVEQNSYIGIEISADLKWSTHMTGLGTKAGSTRGFLRRNLRNCAQECRRLAYIALVRSTLEYGAVVWDPYLKQDTENLQRIQRQAAGFITRDYRSREPGCIGRILDFLDLPPLEERRRQLRLSMLYNIAKGLVPALPTDAFLTAANRNRRRIRPTIYEGYETHNILQRQANKTDQYRGSFFVKTVIEWNTLTDDIINRPTLNAFSFTVGRQRVALNG